jgi:hypothetical protein
LSNVNTKEERPVYDALVAEETLLEGMTTNIVAGTLSIPTPRTWEFLCCQNDELEHSKHIFDNLLIGRTIVNVDSKNRFNIKVMNTGVEPIALKTLMKIASLEFLGDTSQILHKNQGRHQKQNLLNKTKPDYMIARVASSGIAKFDSLSDKPNPLKPVTFFKDNSKNIFISKEVDIADNIPPLQSENANTDEEFLLQKLDLSSCVLSDDGKFQLKTLILKNKEAFVLRDKILGLYTGPIQTKLELIPGAKPYVARARREHPTLKEEQRKQDDEMLKQGIIVPSTSLWCAPARLVMKRNGSYRYAVDYRGLNAVTVKETYFLPLIVEHIETAARSCLFSSFDFESGFFQLPLYEKHRERTAFQSFYGLMMFTRVPMGIVNAPGQFQRVMDDFKFSTK